ncbi:MAG: YlxR family protein [Coriobacteriales bacterium]|jgi:predicted RNA-binding protein YlxR (DUF448 family)|nr:YlxR family protein [Coriobacteriales bacterium]
MKTAGSKKPLRTCVVCGRNDAKDHFVRFVRKDGVVVCDASGRAAGRGAYLCAEEACFELAAKKGRLGRSLKCPLSAEDYQRLGEAFSNICQDLRQAS